ncbi:hypothetical protein IGJ62_003212 [Enterococcus pernyi]
MRLKKNISLFFILLLTTNLFPFQLVKADELNNDIQMDNSLIECFNNFNENKIPNTKEDLMTNTDITKKNSISSSKEVNSSLEKAEEPNKEADSSLEKAEEPNKEADSSLEKVEEPNKEADSSLEDINTSNFDFSANNEFRAIEGNISGIHFQVRSNNVYILGWYKDPQKNLIIDQNFINQIRDKGATVKQVILQNKFFLMAKDVEIVRVDTNIDVPVKVTGSLYWVKLYQNRTNLREFNLGNAEITKIDDLSYMFSGCTNLEKVVMKNMKSYFFDSMFLNCLKLTEVDLGVLTEGLEMPNMFSGCRSLKTVNSLNNWKTDYITKVQGMFNNCMSLTELDLSNWNLKNVTNMNQMFSGTNNLKLVRFERFNPEKKFKYEKLFYGNKRNMIVVADNSYLQNYNFSADNVFPIDIQIDPNGGVLNNSTSRIHYFDKVVLSFLKQQKLEMSYFNDYLKSLGDPVKDASIFVKWQPSKNIDGISSVIYLDGVVFTAEYDNYDWRFEYDKSDNTYKLTAYLGTKTDIIVPNEINGKPTKIDLTQAFPLVNFEGSYKWRKVTSVKISNQNGKKVKAIGNGVWFKDWRNMKSFDGSGLDVSDVKDMGQAFNECHSLEYINLSGWNTSNVENMSQMFRECWSLSEINVSSFNTNKVRDMSQMFYNCSGVDTINVTNFNTENVTSMNEMFKECFTLKYLDLSSFKFSKNPTMNEMFKSSNKPLPLLIYSDDQRLQDTNYDYKADNRVSASFPKLDANGGNIENQSTVSYITTVCIVSSTVKLSTFNEWKEKYTPTRENYVFARWIPSRDIQEATTIFDLLDVTYLAEWGPENIIPYPDNVKPDVSSAFGFAYYPKQFSIGTTKLNHSGPQTISFEKSSSFSVGIRDIRDISSKWNVDAQLLWTGDKKIDGGEILTTNNGSVNKNINNGKAPFDPSKDLIPCDTTEVSSKANVVIKSNIPTRIMTAKATTHNGVYDYNLGDKVSLRIPETKYIGEGSYSGYVQWILSNTID